VCLLRGTDWVINPFNLVFKLLSSYGKVAKLITLAAGTWADRTFGTVRSNRALNTYDYDEATDAHLRQ
jgi:hypothetical protein